MNLRSLRRFHYIRALCALLLAAAVGVPGAAQQGFGNPPQPLPQDTGVTALRQMLRRLQTTARLMETTAHPDDEDGPMLTLESRGKGVTALSFTLTRGEGGQNRTGSNLFDLLGILRTLEVVASDRYYGVEQRFSHVADFGFSKTAEETLQKWNGGEPALSDMVRVIRQFRPDVIVSRFQGTPRDGHGHHQASGILTRQAFRAAADPTKFPEQIREGLQPWQAKKLYVGMFRRAENEPYTVALDTGVDDPLLGTSYAQFALEGLKHQESQGVGNWTVPRGPRLTYYKLADSILPMPAPGVYEKDFFDGIDTSLPGLASRFTDDAAKLEFLRKSLAEVQDAVEQASRAAASTQPAAAAVPLMHALRVMDAVRPQAEQASVRAATKETLQAILREKQSQLQQAVNLALGVEVSALLKTTQPNSVAVAGQKSTIGVTLINHGPSTLELKAVKLEAPTGWKVVAEPQPKRLAAGQQAGMTFYVTPPPDARPTQPWEHRADPERDAVYEVDEPRYLTLPFPPPPLEVVATYVATGTCKPAQECPEVSIRNVVEANASGSNHPLAVAPAFSILLEPGTQAVGITPGGDPDVAVQVHTNSIGAASTTVPLEVPPGWRAEPSSLPVTFDGTKPDQTLKFKIFPGRLAEKAYTLKAVLNKEGKQYTEGYTVVTRPDLGEFFYYQPAVQKISAVDLKLPPQLKVGYIMGAGDDIPTVLQQVGLDVHLITPQELANGDLGQYRTIVVGIRAYDVRDDVRANNRRLLDYVKAGGTLIVQYNANITDFNAGHYTPYPLQLSRARVTVEDAPVEVLAPQDRLFHAPNQITAHDFDGWVQERGLYFADQWDGDYESLLAAHDPGEPPQKGGLLRTRYGKGTYIYTGYAFFRQLPAGVPGAVRLFVNLLSAGQSPQ